LAESLRYWLMGYNEYDIFKSLKINIFKTYF
jgi:hypothetical protein